ncbi:MAG: LPS-assembly protein LptD, partial [Spirochaetes bacterium]|nr:LPS-assembly protein LptD [Spirochaetota bacterium]
MKNRRFLLILLFSLFLPAYSRGQENDDGGEGVDYYLYAGEAEAWEPTQEERLLELEIRTSSLPELAAWSRTLGLPEAGTRAELAARLRAHFNLDFTTEQDDAGRRIITIESARVTEYFTIEIVDEEFARLSGGVSISLIDGEATHRISAQEILFNRTRNILTARGGVEYLREEGGTTESFRGDSITVDLDNWTSVFLDGASYRALGGEGGTFSIEGRVITAGNEDVTIIEGATIRNAENPEALWSITASRLWLLPGSDFAIFNAFLRVGEIPVLYIPFFYYPASEIVFRPVLGFRSREGAFVQTTTYLLGRPTREGTAESSLTRLLGADPDAEMVLEGIFLRNTGRLVQDPQTTSLSVLLDYYTSLGFYFGLEFSTPAVGILSNFDISLGIGLTRTIFQDGLFHTPFAPDEDHFISGQSDWNRSNLFGWDVPFRYRFRLSSAVSGSLGGFSWSIPFYSDPFVDMDFMERSTAMDWLGMAQQGVAITEQDRLLMQIPAYQWELSGNLHFGSLIGGLSPFISTLALTSITSTVFFNSVNMPTNHPNFNPHSPSRAFFSPDRFQIYSVTGVISGTLFSRSGFQFTPPAAPEPEHDFGVIGTPRSPWQRDDDEEDAPPHASSIPQLAPP